ncbi:hypothetical protein J6590_038794 [Homalodisca vitripennis]|nr:hypothetical protein J6590_038794 [Homalodisca vitripennis]
MLEPRSGSAEKEIEMFALTAEMEVKYSTQMYQAFQVVGNQADHITKDHILP